MTSSTRTGGLHSTTAVLANALSRQGLFARGTGKPLSEALVFGIGGGIGAGYWLFEYREIQTPLLSIFLRHGWETETRYVRDLLTRLKVDSQLRETGAAASARRHLEEGIKSERTVIAWPDVCLLPHHPPNKLIEMGGGIPQVVGVTSFDETTGNVLLDDRAAFPRLVALEAFNAARANVKAAKNCLVWIDSPPGPIDIRQPVLEGILAWIAGMSEPLPGLPKWAATNCGLAGLDKWAALMVDSRDKKGWPKVFSRGRALYSGLTTIYQSIEQGVGGSSGTGGGGFRPLFGAFLREAAVILEKPDLIAIAERFDEIGVDWVSLAHASLPGALAETRTLLDRRARALVNSDDPRAEYAEIASQLDVLGKTAVTDFPLTEAETRDLLNDLGTRIREIALKERVAINELAQLIQPTN